jgi:hypothetical protein
MRALKNYKNSYWLLLLLLLPGLAILAVCLVNSTASAVGDETAAPRVAPLNPAFVEYMQKQGNLQKGATPEPNYGYVPSTVDLSHIERLRTPQN